MYKKEDFTVTVPSKEYLTRARLISKLGFVCRNLDDECVDYWTSSPSYINNDIAYGFRVDEDGEFNHSDIHDSYWVRPILMADNLSDIVKAEPLHLYKKGFPMVEFGKWYKPKAISVGDLSSLNVRGMSYQFNNHILGIETEVDSELYTLLSDKLYSVVPLNWYYDRENKLLLSEKALFEAPLVSEEKSYYDKFESTSLYDSLNGAFLSSLLEGANRDEAEKDSKAVLVRQIGELLKENERLREENQNLGLALEKIKKSIAGNAKVLKIMK